MKNFIYEMAQELFSQGRTIDGREPIAKALNMANSDKKYAGGRGTFNAVAGAYKKAHDAKKPGAWKILDVFRGKNGDLLWRKKG